MATISQRALIRHAIVATLKGNATVAAAVGTRIHPNRFAHWQEDELPAAGIYTLSETKLETGKNPDPDERRISLAIEIIVRENVYLDDILDELSSHFEAALVLPTIGNHMQAMQGQDTLLQLEYKGIELGLASEGARNLGVCVMSFDVDYTPPAFNAPLPNFLQAVTGWDLAPKPDGIPEAVDSITFAPFPQPPATAQPPIAQLVDAAFAAKE